MGGKKKPKHSRCPFLFFAGALALVLGAVSIDHQTSPSPVSYDREGRRRLNPPWFPAGSLKRQGDLAARIRPDPADGRKKISLNVRGNSMRPELKDGDRVVVDVDSDIGQVKVGQWVTYIMNQNDRYEAYYTHKVVAINGNLWTGRRELVTRGVNNPGNDLARVTKENFIGISRKDEP
jgi:hypothetical protein